MNTAELEASIARVKVTKRKLAETLGISETALYNKIQGRAEFKGSEIKTIANELHLDLNDVNLIFFGSSVN